MAIKKNEIDPRVKRTRQLLQQAFAELMYEKGFQAISVQDIAERATVNRATFYAHFVDKYALLDNLIRDQFQQRVAKKLPGESAFTPENLRLLILVVFELLGQVHGHCRPGDKVMAPLFEMTLQEELYGCILGWLRQPLTHKARGFSPEITATLISWAIFGAAVQWSRGPRSVSPEEIAKQIIGVLAVGVLAHDAPAKSVGVPQALLG